MIFLYVTSMFAAPFDDNVGFKTNGTPSISVCIPKVPVNLFGDIAEQKKTHKNEKNNIS